LCVGQSNETLSTFIYKKKITIPIEQYNNKQYLFIDSEEDKCFFNTFTAPPQTENKSIFIVEVYHGNNII
jgi:hypothetical protein